MSSTWYSFALGIAAESPKSDGFAGSRTCSGKPGPPFGRKRLNHLIYE